MDLKQAVATKFGLPETATEEDIIGAVTAAELMNDEAKMNIRNTVLNSFTKSDFDALPKSRRQEVDAHIKGKAYEQREEEFKERYGVIAERGKDYNDQFGLVDLIIAKNKPNDHPKLSEELKAERLLTAQLKQQLPTEYEKGLGEGKSTAINFAKQFAVNSIAKQLVDPKQLEKHASFLNYQYNDLFETELEGDTVVSVSKSDKRPKLDASGNPMSIDAVMLELAKAHTALEFAKIVPNAGRGSQDKASANNGAASKETTSQLLAKMKEQGVNPLSQEGYKMLEEARKATN